MPKLINVRTIREQVAIARAAGLDTFIPERPCDNGHKLRLTYLNGRCVECNKARAATHTKPIMTEEMRVKRNEDAAKWRRENPERTAFFVHRWQLANKQRMKETSKRRAQRILEREQNAPV